MRRRIRGGRGIGDALYVQGIVRHLVKQGVELEVCTDYPEIYQFNVSFSPFSRHNIDYLAHYPQRRMIQTTTQWEDVCLSVGKRAEGAELKIDWTPQNNRFKLESPLLFVTGGRQPMQRKDGYAKEMMPNEKAFNGILRELKKDYFTVYVGSGIREYNADVDLDLNNKTTITDVLDIASQADMFFGQCSFIVPLAESFDKDLLCVWSSYIRTTDHPYMKYITPQKVLSKPTSKYVYDDQEFNEILRENNNSREWPICSGESAGVY